MFGMLCLLYRHFILLHIFYMIIWCLHMLVYILSYIIYVSMRIYQTNVIVCMYFKYNMYDCIGYYAFDVYMVCKCNVIICYICV